MDHHETQTTPTRVLLIPGYWLGGWAWDRVTPLIAAGGLVPEAITLPGLDEAERDRSALRFADHVAHVLDRVRQDDAPCVIVAHSGAGAVATAVLDAVPDRITRVIYVDSGPVPDGAEPRPDVAAHAAELPFPGLDALAANGASLEGMSEADLAAMAARAVPHPAGAVREAIHLSNTERNRVPATLICNSIPARAVQELAASGAPMFAAVGDLEQASYLDAPTGHWPMFSIPEQLAEIIVGEASRG